MSTTYSTERKMTQTQRAMLLYINRGPVQWEKLAKWAKSSHWERTAEALVARGYAKYVKSSGQYKITKAGTEAISQGKARLLKKAG
jgi:hypothetical protein